MTDVSLRSVAMRHGAHGVLSDVTLDLPNGTVLALLGPSECGKTSLLRLIAGFERPYAGEVAVGGQIVASTTHFVPPERRRIGYVPQDGSLFPHLTVAANVGYGLPRCERKGARVIETLETVGLADLAARYPHELSGGQQQRVALARALAPRPRVILLDEPFNALDLELRRAMNEEVVELLRKAGATVVLVTHDPAEAFAAADLVAVMHSGTVMQTGAPESVYRQPASASVARLTGDAHFTPGVVMNGLAQTALGPIRLHGTGWTDGTDVLVMLRPDQITLAEPHCGLKADVIGQRFMGSHTRLSIAIGGMCLDMRIPAPVQDARAFLQVNGLGCAFQTN